MENRKNYFKNLLKSGHFVLALLISSLVMTFVVANYEYKFLSVFFANNHILSLITILFAVFAVVLLIYLCIEFKSKKPTIADSIYIALIVVGLAYFVYVGLVLKTFNLNRLIFPISSLVLGFLFLSIRTHYFYIDATRKPFVPKNKISQYYSALFSQYPFFAIVVISVACLFLSYFLTDDPIITVIKHKTTFIVCSICVLPTIIYAITKANSKTITVFDALACACILALPLILVKLVLLTYSPLKVCVWAVAFAIFIIYQIIRFQAFDITVNVQPQEKHDYFSTLFAKYDIGLILSVGGLIATFSSLLIDGDLLHPLYDLKNFHFDAYLIPIVVLTALSLFALIFFAFVPLFGLKKSHVGIIDLFLLFCLSFIIFSFIALISHPSILMLILLIAFLLYTSILLTIRVHSYHKN